MLQPRYMNLLWYSSRSLCFIPTVLTIKLIDSHSWIGIWQMNSCLHISKVLYKIDRIPSTRICAYLRTLNILETTTVVTIWQWLSCKQSNSSKKVYPRTMKIGNGETYILLNLGASPGPELLSSSFSIAKLNLVVTLTHQMFLSIILLATQTNRS